MAYRVVCVNNPLKLKDPTGHDGVPWHALIHFSGALYAGVPLDQAWKDVRSNMTMHKTALSPDPTLQLLHAMNVEGSLRNPQVTIQEAQRLSTWFLDHGADGPGIHIRQELENLSHQGQLYTGLGDLFFTPTGWTHLYNDWIAPLVQMICDPAAFLYRIENVQAAYEFRSANPSYSGPSVYIDPGSALVGLPAAAPSYQTPTAVSDMTNAPSYDWGPLPDYRDLPDDRFWY